MTEDNLDICRAREDKVFKINTTQTATEHKKKNPTGGFFYVQLPFSKHCVWKLKEVVDLQNITADDIEVDIEKELEIDTQNRYKKLEKLFKEKWIGIQRIIIDKEYMNDKDTILSQISSYNKLADEARNKIETLTVQLETVNNLLVDDEDNEELLTQKTAIENGIIQLQPIVDKNNEALSLSFDANLLMQKARGILELMIAENDPKIDEKLSFVQDFKMSKEDFGDEDKADAMLEHLMS